jgi:hypothetical protein
MRTCWCGEPLSHLNRICPEKPILVRDEGGEYIATGREARIERHRLAEQRDNEHAQHQAERWPENVMP